MRDGVDRWRGAESALARRADRVGRRAAGRRARAAGDGGCCRRLPHQVCMCVVGRPLVGR
eukprot:306051-Chlamydomonas_euryale.AAC.2